MQRKIWLIVGLILGLSGITVQAKSVREYYEEFNKKCSSGQCDNGLYHGNNYYKQGERYNIYSNTSFVDIAYRPNALTYFVDNDLPHAVIFEYPAAKFISHQDVIKNIIVTTYWNNNTQHHLGSETRTLNGQQSWLESFFQGQTPHPNFIKSTQDNIVFINSLWLQTKFNQINLNDPDNFFRLVERLANIVSDALTANPDNLIAAKIAADEKADELAQTLTNAQRYDGGESPDDILNPGHDYRCRKVKNYGSDDEHSAYPQKSVAESAPENQSLLRSAGAGSVQQSETKLILGRAAITACQKTLPARHWQSTENLDACSPTVPAAKEVCEISFESPLPSAPCTETDDEDINQR